MPTCTMSAYRQFSQVPAQRNTTVRLFRSEEGQVPEVIGRGNFSCGFDGPYDVVITADGTTYLPSGSWEPLRGEWVCTAKAIQQDPLPEDSGDQNVAT